MRRLFWHWFISALALMCAAAALHVNITPWYNAIWLAPLFGLINGLVGALAAIISLLALPVTVLTLGCFGFVVSFLLNVTAIYLLCGPTGPLNHVLPLGGQYPFLQAVELAIVLALFSTVLNMLLPGKKR